MRRNDFKDRCHDCFQREEFCLCAELPKLDLSVKVIFLIHRRESAATTNTGKIAARALVQSEIRWRGVRGIEFDVSDLDPQESLLLFPSTTALELGPPGSGVPTKPKYLIVPDGSWTQATRCVRRSPALMNLPKVKLPPGVRNPYRIRKTSAEQGERLSTLEAVGAALAVWEGAEVGRQLHRLYHRMAEQTLISRGRIKRLGERPEFPLEIPNVESFS